jgi:hypothetical protein
MKKLGILLIILSLAFTSCKDDRDVNVTKIS